MSKTEKKKLGLIPKLLIAIGLGTLAGLYMPQWFVKTAVTFSSMFGAFL
ncbi:MAG: dicarboxylate/amino acid:cation symporter, partial [Finegoldia magna]|nr:dicarboxylate/amino acid:cation symporter [Finegoldia magna]